ncbi:hypothetical protein PMIN02_001246 [Paraphaeosphaeria minitans]
MSRQLQLNVAVVCIFWVAANAALNSTCKCISSASCWPSPVAWMSLNDTLEGRVHPTVLPKSVCPQGGAASDTYIVNATEAKHIQAALLFAGENNLKVNVNNTGHAGTNTQRSSTCGALYIHTHHMKGIEFYEAYTPQSCSRNVTHMAATLGAGEQDDDVFQALAKHQAVTVGGTYDTVGIVGWATSGGHGWLTSTYGQGADNIYEVEIVTPTGKILIANECQNTDIFWATRGGGGGTYGVISKITVKAYPMPQTTQWAWDIASRNGTSAKDWSRLVAELNAMMIDLNNEGFQGYYTITGSAEGPWTFGGYFMAYDKSTATVQKTLSPFSAALNASTHLATLSFWNVDIFDTWIEAYNALPKQVADNTDGPGGVISVTRLLTREDLTKDVDVAAEMFESIAPNSKESELGVSGHVIAGSMIASAKPVDDALNPAWRNAGVHMVVKASWDKSLPTTTIQQIQDRMTDQVGYAMRRLSPDSGCYINECDQYEPNWQWALYGPNYSRLRSIKAKYDPAEVLWCRKCVRSDEWRYDMEDGSLCRQGLITNWPSYSLSDQV